LSTDGEFVSRDDGAAGVGSGEGDEGGWDVGDEDLELPDVVCLISFNFLFIMFGLLFFTHRIAFELL
jgi:hypothetical protein